MRGREPEMLCGVVRVGSDRGRDKVVSMWSHKSGDDASETDEKYADGMVRVLLIV